MSHTHTPPEATFWRSAERLLEFAREAVPDLILRQEVEVMYRRAVALRDRAREERERARVRESN